jgi:hypothetical protein
MQIHLHEVKILQIHNASPEFFLILWAYMYIIIHTSTYYTDISCLGGVFAKNISRETKKFPSRMAREI